MSKKYGGVIELTYELLEEFLAIEDAKITEVWYDRDDHFYIKLRSDKESKYTVPMWEGDCYYHHRLNSEDIKNIWKEKICNKSKKESSIFYKKYSASPEVFIYAFNSNKKTYNTLHEINFATIRDPITKKKQISGSFSCPYKNIFPSKFNIILETMDEEGKILSQMTIFGVEDLISTDRINYTFTADRVKEWEPIND